MNCGKLNCYYKNYLSTNVLMQWRLGPFQNFETQLDLKNNVKHVYLDDKDFLFEFK